MQTEPNDGASQKSSIAILSETAFESRNRIEFNRQASYYIQKIQQGRSVRASLLL